MNQDVLCMRVTKGKLLFVKAQSSSHWSAWSCFVFQLLRAIKSVALLSSHWHKRKELVETDGRLPPTCLPHCPTAHSSCNSRILFFHVTTQWWLLPLLLPTFESISRPLISNNSITERQSDHSKRVIACASEENGVFISFGRCGCRCGCGCALALVLVLRKTWASW